MPETEIAEPALEPADANGVRDSRGHLQEGIVPEDIGRLARESISYQTAIVNAAIGKLEGLTPPPAPVNRSLSYLKGEILKEATRTFTDWGFGEEEALHAGIKEFLGTVSQQQIHTFIDRAVRPVEGWGYRDRDVVARGICRVGTPMLLNSDSTIEGLEHLEIARERPVIFLGNHLAGVDVHALDIMLALRGFEDVANRLTAVVGHKSFEYPFLRHVSLAFGTLQVPQSMSVSTRSQMMGVRALASGARQVIQATHDRLSKGDHLIVFPEGTRSRSTKMLSLMPAIAKYLRGSDAVIVPWAHHGTEDILPPDTFTFRKGTVHIKFGSPIDSNELMKITRGTDRQKTMMDVVGFRIASLLPASYQGHYRLGGDKAEDLRRAYDISMSFE